MITADLLSSNSNSKSLKITMPRAIVQLLELEDGQTLYFEPIMKNGRLAFEMYKEPPK